MLAFWMRVITDDAAIKLIFDHVRNIGITALLYGAAVWRDGEPDEVLGFLNPIIVAGLYLIGTLLLMLITCMATRNCAPPGTVTGLSLPIA